MNALKIMALAAAGAWLALAAPVLAQPGEEQIFSFHSDVAVHEDATMTVTETIRVFAAGREIKHGIYRDFPLRYTDALGRHYTVGFEVTAVGRDGRPEGWHTKRVKNGIRVYMGRENVSLPTGDHTYALTYRTSRQLGFFDDHDELYWNVTGNGWGFRMGEVSATVHLPGVPVKEIGPLEGYTGAQGEKGKHFTASVEESGEVAFATTRPLGPGEGLSIVVGWPKGHVKEPTASQKLLWLVGANWGSLVGILGAIIAFIYYFLAWFRVGVDPEAGVIIPLYEPPDGLSPAAARFINRMGYDQKTFAAAVINMAVKGYLTIEEDDGEYTIHRGNASEELLAKEERKIADRLLGSRKKVKLKNTNHARISQAISGVENSLRAQCEKKYCLTNSKYLIPGLIISAAAILLTAIAYSPAVAIFLSFWLTIWTFAVFALVGAALAKWKAALFGSAGRFGSLATAIFMTLFALPFVAFEVFAIVMLTVMTSTIVPVLLVFLVVVNFVFYNLMKAPTLQGRALMDKIDGFRMYLSIAEGDRLEMLHPPEHTSELFERYLPFALALDVEQQWSRRFADVLADAAQGPQQYNPSWYIGSSWHSFGRGGFASSLSTSFSSAISSAATAPGSSSGFSGGGGGGSGGGGGGGGGGGW